MKEASIGSKVIVLGSSGSGKSTFSKRLHELTGLPLIHLDNVWWKPDQTHISRDEFDHRLEELVRGDAWIIDGDYSRTYEVRIRACDTVIFLDYGEDVCMAGITGRVGEVRSDIPWVEHELDPELVDYVRRYQTEKRPALYALLQKYPHKQVLVFKTRAQADEWLAAGLAGAPGRMSFFW